MAENVRRYVREASFDSLASDICIDIDLVFEDDQWQEESIIDPESRGNILHILSDENGKTIESLSAMRSVNDRSLWTLIKIPSEEDTDSVSSKEYPITPPSKYPWKLRIGDQADDTSSCQGSTLDAWEWDEDCYQEYVSLAEDVKTYSTHQSWLPDNLQELDLETELLASAFSRHSEAANYSEDNTLTYL